MLAKFSNNPPQRYVCRIIKMCFATASIFMYSCVEQTLFVKPFDYHPAEYIYIYIYIYIYVRIEAQVDLS